MPKHPYQPTITLTELARRNEESRAEMAETDARPSEQQPDNDDN